MAAPPILTHVSLTQSLAGAPYADRFARVLGSDIGPERVTQVLAMADQGYLWSCADMLEECRARDLHLHGDLQRRELRVVGAPWSLVPPEGSGARGKEIADQCTRWLKGLAAETDLSRSFTGMVADMMGGVFHGRSGHEMTYRAEHRDGGGTWMVPARADFLHPRRFAYVTDWRLHLWDASGTAESCDRPVNTGDGAFGHYPGVPIREVNAIAPGKFVVHTPRVMGSYPTREGVGRSLVWYAMFKRFGVRDWLALVAWAGRGFRVGRYAKGGADKDTSGPLGPNGASDDVDVPGLKSSLANWDATRACVIPDSCEADVKGFPGEGKMHDYFVTFCNAELSKGVHSSTLGTNTGVAGGNRSLGEVAERGELMNARNDAVQCADTIQRDVLLPLVRMNYGEREPVPQWVATVDPSEEKGALAGRMKVYKDMGGKLGQRSAGAALGMPAVEPDEEVLAGPSKPAAAPATATTLDPATTAEAA